MHASPRLRDGRGGGMPQPPPPPLLLPLLLSLLVARLGVALASEPDSAPAPAPTPALATASGQLPTAAATSRPMSVGTGATTNTTAQTDLESPTPRPTTSHATATTTESSAAMAATPPGSRAAATAGRRPRAQPVAVVAVAAPPPAPANPGVVSNTAVDDALAAVSDTPLPVSFGTENSTVVVAQLGGSAFVPCIVFNIGDGVVSWIRRKDYHLLTVGLATYTRDERYEMVHQQHSEEWTLKIKYVQDRDAGLYECQVSSHPPTSNFIELRVVEARAEISGSAEKYLKVGSSLRLECVLRQSTAPPLYIFWYHNNRMINYDSGVNVTTDKEAKTSTLHISGASRADSGNYSCVPNNAQPASTYVHILNAGENPAAMQHGLRGLAWLQSPSTWLLLACLVASTWTAWPPRRR